jgi:hypothetical protein
MSKTDRKARAIPDEFLPLVEQGLLNLAANGEVRIIRDGKDVTRSLLAQAGRINKDYETALTTIRAKRSINRKPTSADRPTPPTRPTGIKPTPPKMKQGAKAS